MKNELYHSVNLTFQWWIVVAILIAIMMFALGTTKYRINRHNKIVRLGKGNRLLEFQSAVGTIIMIVLVVQESILGIMQIAMNSLSEQELGWWPFATAMILFFMGVAFYILFYLSGIFGEWVMKNLLKFLIKYSKKKREKQREAMIEEVIGEIKKERTRMKVITPQFSQEKSS